MKKCGIYKITSPTNKVYIGQSLNIQQRFWGYMKNSGAKTQYKLYNSLKKYGWNNHISEIIEECNIELLNERERYWQDYYDVTGKMGLNCILVATNTLKSLMNIETRLKISLSKKGKKLSEKHKQKLSIAKKGKKNTNEHKSNISKGHIGYKFSDESKKKMSESKKNSVFF